MRFAITLLGLGLLPVMLAAGLSAQSLDDQQQALRNAKARAAAAEERSENLRQEASNAGRLRPPMPGLRLLTGVSGPSKPNWGNKANRCCA
jgi:hypothetical protein